MLLYAIIHMIGNYILPGQHPGSIQECPLKQYALDRKVLEVIM